MPTVQWFPGHMARARRQVQEQVRLVDVILEVVDARVPAASSNPDLPALTAPRPRIIILNKADLAEPAGNRAWVSHFAAMGITALFVDAVKGAGVTRVQAAVEAAFAPIQAALTAKGRLGRPARAMIVGMPNVGKSSLLNRLAGGRRTRVGARPGVTRGQQWVRVGQRLELLDTPGILLPKIHDPQQAVLLAALGLIKPEVLSAPDIAGRILSSVAARAPAAVAARWGLTHLADEPLANLNAVAAAKSLLLPAAQPDVDRAAHLILGDVRHGRLGPMTFEWPPAVEA